MSIDVGHHANPQHTLPACRIAWFERVRAPPNPSRASEFNDADLARSAPKRHLSLSLWPVRSKNMVAGRQPHAHEGLGHRFRPCTSVDSQLDDVGGVGPPLAHHVHRQSLRRCGKPFGICLHRRRGHRCTGAGQLVARRLADPMAPCAIGICRTGLDTQAARNSVPCSECDQRNSASHRGRGALQVILRALATQSGSGTRRAPALQGKACERPKRTEGRRSRRPDRPNTRSLPARISDARARWRSRRSGGRCGSSRRGR